ncbi:MAG: ribosome recycling factor [Bacteroidales bacterium]|nr:ribosome recycling factor [Bacteroidales bacterium]
MTDDAILVLEEAEESMQHAIQHLEFEFQKIRAGKATPGMLSGVKVEYYGVMTPIEQTANINTPDPHSIVVQPFDKSVIHEIEKAIQNANLGFNPSNEGLQLRINVPPLTEERRLDLVKRAKHVLEESKVGIRNARRHANDEAKKLEKDGLAEDETKKLVDDVQKLTDQYIQKVDHLFEAKEKDIMTV